MLNHLQYWKLAGATLTSCLVFALSLPGKTRNIDALAQAPIRSGTMQRDDNSIPNRQIEAARLFQIGLEQLNNNQLQPAIETFQRVLAIRREIADKEGEKETLVKLGEAYQKQGQNDRAMAYFRQADAITPSTGGASAIAQTPQRDDDKQPTAPTIQATTTTQAVTRTPQRDDDKQPTAPTIPITPQLPQPITQVTQTPQRDDDKQPTTPSIQRVPAQALAQTSQRDDDRQPTVLGIQISPVEEIALRQSLPQSGQAQAIAQTPQRDDDSSGQTLSTQTGAGAIAQTPQRDDDSSRQSLPPRQAAIAQTPQRDDDSSSIARAGDRKNEADRLFQTGVQLLQTNQLQTALTTFQQVVAIRRELNDKIGIGQALFQIGKVYDRLSQPQQAQNYYRQARELGVQ